MIRAFFFAPRACLFAALAALSLPSYSTSQEHKELGRMWTFEHAPLDWFEQAYGFRPTEAWLDGLRASALRYGRWCSASFVSPRGLIITNNHCAQDNVGEVQGEHNWIVDGYFAESLAQEVRVPGLTVQQLVAQRDITVEMNDGLTAEMSIEERRAKARDNRIKITKQAEADHADLTHEVVTLYQGGNYQLYSYRVYDDIRLVCAPPKAIAEFGGDPDNFTFPRFCLDFALLRAWEGGEPADTASHYLKWQTTGPQDGETVFVAGNPGSTGRLNSIAQMEFMRDLQYPNVVERLTQAVAKLHEEMAADPATAKDKLANLLSQENALKATTGYLDGLENPAVMDVKREAERRLREAVAADPELAAKYGDVWTKLEELQVKKREAILSGQSPRGFVEQEQELNKRVGEAAFAVYGTSIPPDATMTLRLSDGVVKGYDYNGTRAPWHTSLYGLYARFNEFGGVAPFDLPDEWVAAESKLDLKTKFNFVTTCDIIGGNSGSPLVDRDGRFVGLVFDGNIESLANRFVFTDDVARTVCVHPEIIIAALRTVYERPKLADELEGKGPGHE